MWILIDLLLLAGWKSAKSDALPSSIRYIVFVSYVFILGSALLAASIVLFNRPRTLVPLSMKEETGMAQSRDQTKA
jgi:hypothetical protein